jgi:hypothetical protein
MVELPEFLRPYWDSIDNFDSEGELVIATDFDDLNSTLASWLCPHCNDYWKSTIAAMKQRVRHHESNQQYPCNYCNPSCNKGNRQGFCHIDGRDSVQALYPTVAAQWADEIEFNEVLEDEDEPEVSITVYNEWWPDEIMKCKKYVILRCNIHVSEFGRPDTEGIDLCRHLRRVRLESNCEPGGGRDAHGCNSCTEGGNEVNNYDGRNGLPNTNPELAAELLSHPRGLAANEIKSGSPDRCQWQCGSVDASSESSEQFRLLVGAHEELEDIERSQLCENLANEIETGGLICGHIFEREINARSGNSTPGYRADCPGCINDEILDDGRNSLATRYPFIALDWNYELNELTPDQVSWGWSDNIVGQIAWTCAQVNDDGTICNHVWRTSLYSRTQQSSIMGHSPWRNCPCCNPGTGFNDARIGYYYSLRITGMNQVIFKNGITNVPQDRMRSLSNSLNDEYPNCHYTLDSIHMHPPSPLETHVRILENELLGTNYIRPSEEFYDFYDRTPNLDGGHELFTINAFSYAVEHDIVGCEHWTDVTDEFVLELNSILHRFISDN